jgi:FlaA1/EpsC-like NDP-sugar epimerase
MAAMESYPSGLYRHRHVVALLIYSVVTGVAYGCGYLLRFEFAPPQEMARVFGTTVGVLLVVRLLSSLTFRLNSGRWRYSGTRDVLRLIAASTVGSVLFFVLTRGWFGLPVVPRSIILLEWLLTTNATAALWFTYRVVVEQVRLLRSINDANARRVIVVGAGEAGSLLVREMTRVPTGYRPVGLIDDNPETWRSRVHGFTVFGGIDVLAAVARRLHADEIVIAVPSASPAALRRIVHVCEATNLRFKVLPGVASVLAGNVGLNQVRDLRIEDLLGREPIMLELPELYEDMKKRTVMITGAAGSIGSELSHQVAMHDPELLVLVDQAETPLFFLEQQLREKFPNLRAAFIVSDITDAAQVARLFAKFTPSAVYHAAAYKHVNMMQLNAREAVRNNVLGTWILGTAAAYYGAEKVVLVSTDKAVRPTSIMGASKRLAEQAMLELQRRHPHTSYTAVRFGNVLGSNGSVIPIFQRQLEEGKPLTVTDPKCTRYFMTIPEAVHLILQAASLREMKGRIAMLEMGEPVRIADLAKTMLRLVGRNTEDIVFTGLRNGEKLHEELTDAEEETVATEVAKVRLVQPATNPPSLVARWFDHLNEWLVEEQDSEIIAFLKAVFPTIDLPNVQEVEHELPPLLAMRGSLDVTAG